MNHYHQLHAALNHLRETDPMGYAQILMLPFNLIPCHAEEGGPDHEWFSSDEAREKLEMLTSEQ